MTVPLWNGLGDIAEIYGTAGEMPPVCTVPGR